MLADVCRVMVLLMVTGGLVAAAAPLLCDLQSSCSFSDTQDEDRCICTDSRPYEDFCSSDGCTYPVPKKFKPLLKKDCEVTWCYSNRTTLAYLQPQRYESPVTDISEDHLTTAKHVEGLTLSITFNDENARHHHYQTVYTAPQEIRAPPTTAAEPGNLPRSHICIWIIVPVFLAICATVIFGLIGKQYHTGQQTEEDESRT